MVRVRDPNAGFTLVEVMITVAIIAVLAAIAVPAFTKETRKSKSSSEVGAMFAELAIRQDQYKLENGVYLETATCPAGALTAQGQDPNTCLGGTNPWEPLRVRPAANKLYCSYEIVTDASASTTPPTGFTFTPPGTAWFFIHARCDMDGDGNVSSYFSSSVDQAIQKLNDGE